MWSQIQREHSYEHHCRIRATSQTFQSAHKRMGFGLSPSQQAALAGQSEDTAATTKPAHDPKCFLCSGNTRINGEVNPSYTGPYVFPNDFPALLSETTEAVDTQHPLLQAEPVSGTARVICFSERHDLTLPEMEVSDVRRVVDLWVDQTEELGKPISGWPFLKTRARSWGAPIRILTVKFGLQIFYPVKWLKRINLSSNISKRQEQTFLSHMPRSKNAKTSASWQSINTGLLSCRIGRHGLLRHCCCRVAT